MFKGYLFRHDFAVAKETILTLTGTLGDSRSCFGGRIERGVCCLFFGEYTVVFIISMQCNRFRSVAQCGSSKEPIGSTTKSN